MTSGVAWLHFILRETADESDAVREAVEGVLLAARVGWSLEDASPKLKGDETRRLFDAWPDIAALLGCVDSPKDHAVMDMRELLRNLYRTAYPDDACPSDVCAEVVREFKDKCTNSSAGGGNYLYQMEHDFPQLLEFLHGLGFCVVVAGGLRFHRPPKPQFAPTATASGCSPRTLLSP